MVDQRAIRPQFFDKHLIAQPLRRAQIAGVTGQPQDQGIRGHGGGTLFQRQLSYRAMRPKGEGFVAAKITEKALLKNLKSGQSGAYQ